MVADFAQNTHSINTVSEFSLIHERNMKMLHDYVLHHNDNFIKELLLTIPEVRSSEIKEFIEHDRGMSTNKKGIFLLVTMFFNSGKEVYEILKEKFDLIANRNKTIIMILNNSSF